MDWPLDNAGLSEADFNKVFRYEPKETTVVRLLPHEKELKLWSHKTPVEWETWLWESMPSIGEGSGLALILAQRAGETAGVLQHHSVEARFNEKDRSYSWPIGKIANAQSSPTTKRGLKGGKRELRELPFQQDTFRQICNRFCVHGSISRTVSRADVSLFSRAEVTMGSQRQQAIVYNCRSANTWGDDLALAVTYFPNNKLTLAILFGCTASTEKQVLNRLSKAGENAFHPMVLPGIFAELERARMFEVVESTIDEIEGAIFELDSGSANRQVREQSRRGDFDGAGHPSRARSVRRKVWLNTTFLRSRLRIWRMQLLKMVEHVDELRSGDLGSPGKSLHPTERRDVECVRDNKHEVASDLQHSSQLIKDRLRTLIEEFDDKIDECSMRVDGMTIATQWAQGDTNVDIATAAASDSSQMRSISLVTMIFLPGTFFATLFSMTFFNWFPSNGKSPVVSGYVWIYFLLTIIFTVFTLVSWWYFLVYRQGHSGRPFIKRWKGCCV